MTATFETTVQGSESSKFKNYGHIAAINNHTSGGTSSQYLNGGYAGMIGVANSYKVYPGDQLKIGAYGSYNAPTNNSSSLVNFATAFLSAFGLPTPVAGEAGTASAAINNWGGLAAGGLADGTTDQGDPKAFVTILLFDKNYQFLDMTSAQLKGTSLYYMTASYTVKEAGYAYMYVSNEQPVQTDVYFDDVTMTYTPTNVLQYNEYYPFGLQTAESWTRDSAVPNSYLYDAGNELNATTGLYDLEYRNYDPVLGRFLQVDLLTESDDDTSPYAYADNDPISYNDPLGLETVGDIVGNIMRRSQGHGGAWDNTGGTGTYNTFGTETEAMMAGINYNEKYDSWGKNGTLRSVTITARGNGSYGGEPYYAPQTWLHDRLNEANFDYWTWARGRYHDALDVVGLIPGIGEVADGINAAGYLTEGDYKNAALSSAAMVPFLGWGATGAKLTSKIVRKTNKFDGLLKQAAAAYPKKAGKIEWHHIDPKYLHYCISLQGSLFTLSLQNQSNLWLLKT